MGQSLTPVELDAEARARASHYAPLPKWDPTYAGLIGAAVVGFPLAIFAGLARLNLDAFPFAFAITVGLGFLLPFGYLKHQQREHYRAWYRELEALRAKNDA